MFDERPLRIVIGGVHPVTARAMVRVLSARGYEVIVTSTPKRPNLGPSNPGSATSTPKRPNLGPSNPGSDTSTPKRPNLGPSNPGSATSTPKRPNLGPSNPGSATSTPKLPNLGPSNPGSVDDDGRDTLALLARAPADVLIADGVELLRWVHRAHRGLPVLVASAVPERDEVVARLGYESLEPPISPRDLIAAVERAVTR